MNSFPIIPTNIASVRDGGPFAVFVRIDVSRSAYDNVFPGAAEFIFGTNARLGTQILARLLARVLQANGCPVLAIGWALELTRGLIWINIPTEKFPINALVAELESMHLGHCSTVATYDARESDHGKPFYRVHFPPLGSFTFPDDEIAVDLAKLNSFVLPPGFDQTNPPTA